MGKYRQMQKTQAEKNREQIIKNMKNMSVPLLQRKFKITATAAKIMLEKNKCARGKMNDKSFNT